MFSNKALVACVFLLGSAFAQAKEFIVYDATQYEHKPDLRRYGIMPMPVLYDQWAYNDRSAKYKKENLPDRAMLAARVKKEARSSGVIVLDFESWPVMGYSNMPWVMSRSAEKYVNVLRWVKSDVPKIKVGFFGIVPPSDYLATIAEPSSRRYQQWIRDNNLVKAIANEIDIAFPSVYTYSADRSLWKRSLRAQVSEARRLFGGAVYVFIWPQYFDHAPADPELWLKYMDGEFWRFQLDEVRAVADGVVVWGGWDFERNRPAKWDPNAAWWQETKRFSESNKLKHRESVPK